MKKKRLLFPLRGIFFLLPLLTAAQQPTYNTAIQQFTTRDGLSHNEVFSITKDERGILWVGTKLGLNRFDGKTFKIFGREQGLRHNTVDQLYPDGRYLWIIYRSRAANIYYLKDIDIIDIYTEKVVPFAQFFGDKLPFKWEDIDRCILLNDRLAFILKNEQYIAYQRGRGFSKPQPFPIKENMMGLTDNCFWTMQYDSLGSYLRKYTLAGKLLHTFAYPAAKGVTFGWLHETDNQTTYFVHYYKTVGTRSYNGIIGIDTNYKITPYFYTNLHFILYDIKWNPALNLFVYASEHNFAFFDFKGNCLLYEKDVVKSASTMNRQPFYDKDVIWQCSNTGLYKVQVTQHYFKHAFTYFNPQVGFRGMTRIGNTMYFNCEKGVFKRTDGEATDTLPILPNSLASTTDSNGILWTSNFGKLYRYEPVSKKQQTYYTKGNETWAIYAAKDGKVWLSYNGIVVIDPTTAAVTKLAFKNYPELSHNLVYHFVENSPRELFACTTSGFYVIDPATKTVKARYWSGGKGKYYLPATDFRHFYQDKKTGIVWLATGQDGMVRWNTNTGETKTFTFFKGASNVVHAVYADDFGYLWMPTDNGLIQFDTTTFNFRIYTTKDGLNANEFNRIANFKDIDGTLYFGNVDGVTYFHPKFFKNRLNEVIDIRPVIVELQQYVGKNNRLENLTSDLKERGRIFFHSNDRYLTLHLGVENADWNEATYFYQIKNKDTAWTKIEGNQLTIGRVPFGWQTIAIKALLENGQFSNTSLDIPVYVQRPVHLRWWFFLIYMSIVAGGFYLFYFYKINQFKQQQQERTRIATDLHDDVGSVLSRLMMQAEMMKYVSKERAAEIVNDMVVTSRIAVDMMRDIIWAVDARNDDADNLLLRMEQQLEAMLSPANIDYRLDTKGVVNKKILPYNFRQNIFLIFKEAIHNIVKHSTTTVIQVEIIYTATVFIMDIKELAGNRNRIPSYFPSGGKGLNNMQLRAKSIGATLSIGDDYHIRLTKSLKTTLSPNRHTINMVLRSAKVESNFAKK